MKNANIDKKISLSDLNRPKDYIEVAERYPFAIRNIYSKTFWSRSSLTY